MNDIGKGRVLIIAGSDSGGGAGIQGDLKSVTALGGYGATAITALTAQNTQGVQGIFDVPDDFIALQIKSVLDDIGADAIKTGMLHKSSVIDAVARVLASHADIPLILDPVMVAKGGAPLLEPAALDALTIKLIPRALVITPNIPEAELLLQNKITTLDDMKKAATALLALGPRAVLLKGGHMEGDTLTDVFIEVGGRAITIPSTRIATRHTHGTGCALASAVATGIAQGMALEDAVMRAHAYVQKAILAAPGLGQGHGPLGHLAGA